MTKRIIVVMLLCMAKIWCNHIESSDDMYTGEQVFIGNNYIPNTQPEKWLQNHIDEYDKLNKTVFQKLKDKIFGKKQWAGCTKGCQKFGTHNLNMEDARRFLSHHNDKTKLLKENNYSYEERQWRLAEIVVRTSYPPYHQRLKEEIEDEQGIEHLSQEQKEALFEERLEAMVAQVGVCLEARFRHLFEEAQKETSKRNDFFKKSNQ